MVALCQYVRREVLVSCCNIVGCEGGCRANLNTTILQNQSIANYSSGAVGGAGVEADAHARRGVVGVGGNAQAWRLRRYGVERLALRRGNGGQAGGIANGRRSVGNGTLHLCRSAGQGIAKHAVNRARIGQIERAAAAASVVEFCDQVADNRGSGTCDGVFSQGDDGCHLRRSFLGCQVTSRKGVVAEQRLTRWNRQAQVGCHRCGSCGGTGSAARGLHNRFNKGCQWVDGGGAFGRLQRHRVGHAGVDIHATDGDDAATGGAGRDEEIAAGVSGADKIISARVCRTVAVGIDVNGSAAHIAVRHHAAGKAHCVIAGKILNGSGIVARRGVGVTETDCTGAKSAGHGQCHDRTGHGNTCHCVGAAAGCYREGRGGRQIGRVKRAVVGQFNCFRDTVRSQ